MWEWDEIEAMNLPGDRQESSRLSHLISQGAATPDLLCYAAQLLDDLGEPNVIAFAQLPFPVEIGPEPIRVQGSHHGVNIDLRFIPKRIRVSPTGQLQFPDFQSTLKQDGTTELLVTQVIASVRLWGWRERDYKMFAQCVSHNGLREETVIGHVRHYMELSEATMELPRRRPGPLTAGKYQAAVTERLRSEIHIGIQSVVRAYGLAMLDELPIFHEVYGFFVMLAPGLVSSARFLLPLLGGICQLNRIPQGLAVDRQRIERILSTGMPLENKIINQLMAMQRLLREGEPELALVGCISAIEWYLNDAFPNIQRTNASGVKLSASISKHIKLKTLAFLPEEKLLQLNAFVQRRNDIVHGAPPHRSPVRNTRGAAEIECNAMLDVNNVRNALALGFDIYREVNIRKSRSPLSNCKQSVSQNVS